MTLAVRLAASDERNFVADSWVRSHASSAWASSLRPDATTARDAPRTRPSAEYYAGHARLVDRLLERSAVRVVEANGIVAGWACVDSHAPLPIVHYAYVRQLYRREGIARALLADLLLEPALYSHRTYVVVASRLPRTWRFDPYAAFLEQT